MTGDSRDERCVLVVDDDEDVRETLREVVEMVGCSAVLASNGAEALELLAERRPCLMILDLLMPVMTGNELIAAMQQRPELASLPVVISTSAPDRAPFGFPVIAKPIDIQKVWDQVRQNCTCLDPATS
jgi:two-component system response regulator CpxR